MKSFLIALVMLSSSVVMSAEIKNTANQINAGRIAGYVSLVNKDDIKVNLVVADNGGSTDVSPTQELFFNIYTKGEMFSTDASFNLGYIYSLVKATRVSGGVYEVVIEGANEETSMPELQTLVIDAQKAIVSIKKVQCDDFDCEASTNFSSSIEVTKK